jgi:hypothetical protein
MSNQEGHHRSAAGRFAGPRGRATRRVKIGVYGPYTVEQARQRAKAPRGSRGTRPTAGEDRNPIRDHRCSPLDRPRHRKLHDPIDVRWGVFHFITSLAGSIPVVGENVLQLLQAKGSELRVSVGGALS